MSPCVGVCHHVLVCQCVAVCWSVLCVAVCQHVGVCRYVSPCVCVGVPACWCVSACWCVPACWFVSACWCASPCVAARRPRPSRRCFCTGSASFRRAQQAPRPAYPPRPGPERQAVHQHFTQARTSGGKPLVAKDSCNTPLKSDTPRSPSLPPFLTNTKINKTKPKT